MAQQETFDLVVIGSSAGGIDALITLVGSLPADFPAPIVLAQHLDPGRESHLEAILARHSALPVRTVVDKQRLEPGVILVAPSNRDVAVTDHELSLRSEPREGSKPSVDLLLSSASAVFGERAIAVILTGLGSDGTAGARVVSAGGGMVIIQNPATASYPGMPSSLAPATVDVVADLEAIGPLLVEIVNGTYAPNRSDEDRLLRSFLDDLRQRSGIDFGSYRQPTIARRLQRRIAATGSHTLRAYIRYLHRHPDEYQRLTSSFLIKVTDFYRDADLFRELREKIVPEVVGEAVEANREIRFWSAGCATGEEAYSLAILLYDVLGERMGTMPARVFATDLDAEAIAFARRGVYPLSALTGLPPEAIARHFIQRGGDYEIKKHLRAMTVFGQHDLAQRAPFPRIDLVLCRNVLIYFTPELQRRALQLFAFSLRDRGYLVLGKAESTRPLAAHFVDANRALKIYRREGEGLAVPERKSPALPQPLIAPVRPRAAASVTTQRAFRTDDEPRLAGRPDTVLLQLPVGVAVIDANYDIVSINGAARRLLGIHGAAIGGDLIHQARIPTDGLRHTIDEALKGRPSARTVIEVPEDDSAIGKALSLELSAYPTNTMGGPAETVVVMLTDVSRTSDDERESTAKSDRQRARGQRLDRQLARLERKNDELQAANQELLSSNADLTTQNEDLYVANEEVQATTEEVETLNEELQASNEELETLNEELQATIEELNTTNDDLQSRSLELEAATVSLGEQREASEAGRGRLETILANMGDPMLVVSRNGSPIMSNAAYEALFSSDATLLDAAGEALGENATPQARAARGQSFTAPFRLLDSKGSLHWLEAKANPVKVDGRRAAVLQFRDIGERSLRLLHEEFVALAAHELRTPLTALHAYVQLLSRRSEIRENPQLAGYVDTALGESKRLAGLITELSEASRLQGGRLQLDLQAVDLGRLVERVIDISQSLTDTQAIRLKKVDELVVLGDPDRLEQVILNLISNAITHAPGSRYIDVEVRRTDDHAELRVRDRGPGVPREDVEHLFSRFYQVSRKRGGSERGLGLGLYISREIAVAHGGDIRVRSTEGKGTVFTVTLPLRTRTVSAVTATGKGRSAAARGAGGAQPTRPAHAQKARQQSDAKTSADGRGRVSTRCTSHAVGRAASNVRSKPGQKSPRREGRSQTQSGRDGPPA